MRHAKLLLLLFFFSFKFVALRRSMTESLHFLFSQRNSIKVAQSGVCRASNLTCLFVWHPVGSSNSPKVHWQISLLFGLHLNLNSQHRILIGRLGYFGGVGRQLTYKTFGYISSILANQILPNSAEISRNSQKSFQDMSYTSMKRAASLRKRCQ